MGKLIPIERKTTKWEGLWWHPEYNGFSSRPLSLAGLRKFKGQVRLYVRKNKFFNNGENGRPNYNFCLKDADADVFTEIEVVDDDRESEERLYTEDEVRTIINGVCRDVRSGYDAYDLLPEDYV